MLAAAACCARICEADFRAAAHAADERGARLEGWVAAGRGVALFGRGGQVVGGDEDEGGEHAEGGTRGGVVVAAGVVGADLGLETVAGDGVEGVVGRGGGLGECCSRGGAEEAGVRGVEGRRVTETVGEEAHRGGNTWRHVGAVDGVE